MAQGIGYADKGNYFKYVGPQPIRQAEVHGSIYRDSVVAMEGGTPTTFAMSASDIGKWLLPSAGKSGAHVTVEDFERTAGWGNANPSPHYWRGGTSSSGNWAGRPVSWSATVEWTSVETQMKTRLETEIARVEEKVEILRGAKYIQGWPE